jgi:predicted nicotinamide N-methyase
VIEQSLAKNYRSFILTNTRHEPVPSARDIRLHLVNDLTPLWDAAKIEFGQLLIPPPYWGLAWSGGQAIARYVLDHPELVRAKHVLDFAAGSGIAAIAAAQSGAKRVSASDIDELAGAAINLNAKLNGVDIAVFTENFIGRDDVWDVILAGDICYEKPLAEDAVRWLRTLVRRGAVVLVGDPGRDYLPLHGLLRCADYEIEVPKSLATQVGRIATVWRVESGASL